MTGPASPVALCSLKRVEVHDGSTRKSFDANSQGNPLMLSIEAQQTTDTTQALLLLIHAGFQRLLSVRLSDLLKPHFSNVDVVSSDGAQLRLSIRIPSSGQTLVVFFSESRDYTLTVCTLQKSGFQIKSEGTVALPGQILRQASLPTVGSPIAGPRLSSFTLMPSFDQTIQPQQPVSTVSDLSMEGNVQSMAWPSFDHGGLSMSQPQLPSHSMLSPFAQTAPVQHAPSPFNTVPNLYPPSPYDVFSRAANSPVPYQPRVSSPLRAVQAAEPTRSWSNPGTISPYGLPSYNDLSAAQYLGTPNQVGFQPVSDVPAPLAPQIALARSSSDLGASSPITCSTPTSEAASGSVNKIRALMPPPRSLPFSTPEDRKPSDLKASNDVTKRKRSKDTEEEALAEGTPRKKATTAKSKTKTKVSTPVSKKSKISKPKPKPSPATSQLKAPSSKPESPGPQNPSVLPVTKGKQSTKTTSKGSSTGPVKGPKKPKKLAKASEQKATPQTPVKKSKSTKVTRRTPLQPALGNASGDVNSQVELQEVASSFATKKPSNRTTSAKKQASSRPHVAVRKDTGEPSQERPLAAQKIPAKQTRAPKTNLKAHVTASEIEASVVAPAASSQGIANGSTRQAKRAIRATSTVKATGLAPEKEALQDVADNTSGGSTATLAMSRKRASVVKPGASSSPSTPPTISTLPPLVKTKVSSRNPKFSVCDACRKARRKCDRELPTCGRCQKEGLSCSYIDFSKDVTTRAKATVKVPTGPPETQATASLTESPAASTPASVVKLVATPAVESPTHDIRVPSSQTSRLILPPPPSIVQQNLLPVLYDITMLKKLEALKEPLFQGYEADVARGCDKEMSARFYFERIDSVYREFWNGVFGEVDGYHDGMMEV